MQVYKFGGASVNSAQAVRNVSHIVCQCSHRPLVVVVSAMGKTTNALEDLVPGVCPPESRRQRLDAVCQYHNQIIDELWGDPSCGRDAVIDAVETLFAQLDDRTQQQPTTYGSDYDAVVSFGELLSSTIISHYLNYIGLSNQWVDVREIIITDITHRTGRVDWQRTASAAKLLHTVAERLVVTQGFIAGATDGSTTTLGREGSDYSASILSHVLDAESMTIWKDVPGFLNADPKFFNHTVKIEQMPYNEAIEQAYYGASVIHPNTVKPLQNKGIPLYIRSFVTPQDEGSSVGPYPCLVPQVPLYIVRHQQVLLSIVPKDYSFVTEDNLQVIFGIFAQVGVRINVMQNSALSFSVCIDYHPYLFHTLLQQLQADYDVHYNQDLQLITIRYYTQQVIDSIVDGRSIFLEQRSRTTEQLVVPAKK